MKTHGLFLLFMIFATPVFGAEEKVPEPVAQTTGRFSSAVGMGLAVDQQILKQLSEIEGLHSRIGEQTNQLQKLQDQLQEIDNRPTPPEPTQPPFANQNPSGQGGGGSGGGSKGGGGSGLEAPQMAQLPTNAPFELPQAPQEITPDFSALGDSGDGGSSEFNPSSSGLQGFTPPPLDLPKSRNPNTQGQFGPAQVAAQGMPKLKTLEGVSPGAGAGAAAAAGGAAGGAGGAGGAPSMGGGGGGGTGGGGGDVMNGIGFEPGGDAASGIVARDAGWGSPGDGGSESGGGGLAYGDGGGSESSASKIAGNQVYSGPSSKGGRLKRTLADGSADDTIFAKMSLFIDDTCGLGGEPKTDGKLSVCEKAFSNDLQLAAVNEEAPYEGAAKSALKELPKEEQKPELKKPKLPAGLREIASEKESSEVSSETGPSKEALPASEDILSALRAGTL